MRIVIAAFVLIMLLVLPSIVVRGGADKTFYDRCLKGKAITMHVYINQLPRKNVTFTVYKYMKIYICGIGGGFKWDNSTIKNLTEFNDVYRHSHTYYVGYKICLDNESQVNNMKYWLLNGRYYSSPSRCITVVPYYVVVYNMTQICSYESRFMNVMYDSYSKQYTNYMNISIVWKDYKPPSSMAALNVKLNGTGYVYPRAGRYLYKRDSRVIFKARDDLSKGNIFYGWSVNGKIVKKLDLVLTMNHSMNVTAIYKNVRDFANGTSVDIEMEKDQVAKLIHSGWEGRIMFGGPAVYSFDWKSVGVEFLKEGSVYDGLVLDNTKYRIKYGKLDYGVIYVDNDVRIAGVSRYGTRAAMEWYVTHYNMLDNGDVKIVVWNDINSNGKVEVSEVSTFKL